MEQTRESIPGGMRGLQKSENDISLPFQSTSEYDPQNSGASKPHAKNLKPRSVGGVIFYCEQKRETECISYMSARSVQRK